MCQGRENLQKEINRLTIRYLDTENPILFFYLRQERENLDNRLSVTVGFLPTKTSDYGTARATVPLYPWFQDNNIHLQQLIYNNLC